MSRGMTDVLLVDDDPAAPSATEPLPARGPARRGRWWVLSAAVLVVALLVGGQSLLDARERAHTARFDDLPGVLLPLSAPMGARWKIPAEGDRSHQTQAGGRIVAASVTSDAVTVVGLDRATGEPAWTTPVDGVVDLVPDAAPVRHAQCQALDDESGRATRVACVAAASSTNEVTGAPQPVQVLVLDARSGGLLASVRREEWASSWATSGDAVVLVGRGQPGEGLRATAVDADGDVRWEVPLAGAATDSGGDPSVLAAGAFALVSTGDHAWVLDADGGIVVDRPVPPDTGYVLGRTGALYFRGYTLHDEGDGTFTQTSSPTGLLVGQQSTTVVRDELAPPAVDDGSAPDIELMLDGETSEIVGRHGVDGAELWRVTAWSPARVLLEGTIYVQREGVLSALDVRTGDERWQAEVRDTGWHVVTDGRLVYTIGDAGGIEGFRLDSGELAYRGAVHDLVDPEQGGALDLWNGVLILWEQGVVVG